MPPEDKGGLSESNFQPRSSHGPEECVKGGDYHRAAAPWALPRLPGLGLQAGLQMLADHRL